MLDIKLIREKQEKVKAAMKTRNKDMDAIVDEILAVGDANFQNKSKARMMELMSGGTTVLFVSHSIEQIKNLCDRVVWLDHGKIKKIGSAKKICDEYYEEQMK